MSLPGTLREAAENGGISFGTFLGFNWSLADKGWEREEWRVAAREFNSVTPAGLFMKEVQPARGRYDFATADAVAAFAEAHGMRVRGQHLVFHYFLPDWLGWACDRPPLWFELPLWWKAPDPFPPADPCRKCTDPQGRAWAPEQLKEMTADHIRTVMTHFGTGIDTWDIVHEPTSDAGDRLRETCWQQILGEEYIDFAYAVAREAAPHARLFLTEYGAEGRGAKADFTYDLVQRLLARGVPIDGVALQALIFAEDPADMPTKEDMVANMRRLAALGLELEVSELNIGLRMDPLQGDTYEPSPEQLELQRRQYVDVVAACLEVPRCTRVTVNGISDGNTWRFPDKPHLFDAEFEPKPAYHGVRELLKVL